MPKGGAKPGERRGGRAKGTPNKINTEAQERARITAGVAASIGKPLTQPAPAGAPVAVQRMLAKDRLFELLDICVGAAAFHQPAGRGQAPNPDGNWSEFRAWVELAVKTADKAAAYQSPTYKAIAIAAAPPEPTQQQAGKTADIIDINDPVAAARVYRRIVSASGGGR